MSRVVACVAALLWLFATAGQAVERQKIGFHSSVFPFFHFSQGLFCRVGCFRLIPCRVEIEQQNVAQVPFVVNY